MAITDIAAFAHLTEADIDSLAVELDAIRRDVEDSLGERDARYIHRVIAVQRGLDLTARALLAFGGSKRWAWWGGAVGLGLAKIIENMEIGHNVIHAQWDWMNDPEIHSSTWEWDMAGVAKHWRATHNFSHHKYTNILGMDDDVGYGLLRVTRDQPWRSRNLLNPVFNLVLALGFEWGIALQHLELRKIWQPDTRAATVVRLREFSAKSARQLVKDFAAYPALTALSPFAGFTSTAGANLMANVIRNLWTNAVIFCGHFPDGAEKFIATDLVGESRGHWYLRQMLGSANIDAGPGLAFLTGNLSYQIEHHLYPDLPSSRLAEISLKVRAICDKYDLPYTSGPLLVQYGKSWRTIAKLALPDRFLRDSADDAPETHSERMFDVLPAGYRASGLRSALAAVRRLRCAIPR